MGSRRMGTMYHSRMPARLKKKWMRSDLGEEGRAGGTQEPGLRGSHAHSRPGRRGVQVCLRWPLWWACSPHTPLCLAGWEPSAALPCGSCVSDSSGDSTATYVGRLHLPMLHPRRPYSCSFLSGLSHSAPGSGLAPARRSCERGTQLLSGVAGEVEGVAVVGAFRRLPGGGDQGPCTGRF